MVGVGTHIRLALSSFGIRPTQGCRCYQLADEMDRLGPRGCAEQLERLTDEMLGSISEWRRQRGAAAEVIRPPRGVVRRFILWAIDQCE